MTAPVALNAEAARNALRQVKDPELDMNIIDLGLVYDVEIADGEVRVKMTLTSPGCPACRYCRLPYSRSAWRSCSGFAHLSRPRTPGFLGRDPARRSASAARTAGSCGRDPPLRHRRCSRRAPATAAATRSNSRDSRS